MWSLKLMHVILTLQLLLQLINSLLQVMIFRKSLWIWLNDFVFYISTAKMFEVKQNSTPSVFQGIMKWIHCTSLHLTLFTGLNAGKRDCSSMAFTEPESTGKAMNRPVLVSQKEIKRRSEWEHWFNLISLCKLMGSPWACEAFSYSVKISDISVRKLHLCTLFAKGSSKTELTFLWITLQFRCRLILFMDVNREQHYVKALWCELFFSTFHFAFLSCVCFTVQVH